VLGDFSYFYKPLHYTSFKQLADQIGIEGDIDELLADIAD